MNEQQLEYFYKEILENDSVGMVEKEKILIPKLDGYTMDGLLLSNLNEVYIDVTKHDFDAVILITGFEGYGKSTLGGQVAKAFDPTYSLDRCVFTLDQWIEVVFSTDKFKSVVFDEAYKYLSSKNTMSKYNRKIVTILTQIRFLNLFHTILLPSFHELDKYVALWRSRGLIDVSKRGEFRAFDYHSKINLYVKGKKFFNMMAEYPDFFGRFTKHFVYDKKAYDEKKLKSLREAEKEDEKPMGVREKKSMERLAKAVFFATKYHGHSMTEIERMIDMPHERISELIKKHKPMLMKLPFMKKMKNAKV